MNILILGSGGREHALAWAVMQNPKCDKLIVAPGNAGIAQIAECATLDVLDGAAVVNFCDENAIDFIIVGPEAPLAAGISDRLREAGFNVFGPSKAAAQLEASKAFTKEICAAAGAPTAGYGHFTDADAARAHIRAHGAPIVVKADGLAAGKGVIVAMTEAEALAAVDDMFGGEFGAAGAEVLGRLVVVHARRPQRFVGVDVADAADESLVEQRPLDGRALRGEPAPVEPLVERGVERVARDVSHLTRDARQRHSVPRRRPATRRSPSTRRCADRRSRPAAGRAADASARTAHA